MARPKSKKREREKDEETKRREERERERKDREGATKWIQRRDIILAFAAAVALKSGCKMLARRERRRVLKWQPD